MKRKAKRARRKLEIECDVAVKEEQRRTEYLKGKKVTVPRFPSRIFLESDHSFTIFLSK